MTNDVAVRLVAPPEVLSGLVCQAVDTFAPYTEADPMAIASQFIVAFGNAVGRAPHFYVGETRHGMNEFLAVVGRSARARKGDSWQCAKRAICEVDPEWSDKIVNGLSSGEGLIRRVGDHGDDRRLMVVESEFASVLKQFTRQGNVLSNVMRDLWDAVSVQTLTRRDPLYAEKPHVSVIAHTTPEDLRTYLADVDAANGFGNRFMYVLVERRKLLPNPGRVPEHWIRSLAQAVGAHLGFAKGVGELHRSVEASQYWAEQYSRISTDESGFYGMMTARAEAHIARLSALFALLSQESIIQPQHILSAIRFWDYSKDSIRLIFGDKTGNRLADLIVDRVDVGERLNRTTLRERVSSSHASSKDLQSAIDLLVSQQRARVETVRTPGRPAEMFTRLW